MSQLSSKLEWEMAQNKWAGVLNPIIANPITNPTILKNISLVAGVNVINHGLQKTQQGWFISDINAAATVFRSQPFNDKTITLTSSAAVTINLVVF